MIRVILQGGPLDGNYFATTPTTSEIITPVEDLSGAWRDHAYARVEETRFVWSGVRLPDWEPSKVQGDC